MSRPDRVSLFIDLPNLMKGAGTSARTLRTLLTNCVEIARERGRVVMAYAVGDLRHFFPVLDELESLTLKLGLKLIHAPTLQEGKEAKETVDAVIKDLLSFERFQNLEPMTVILVSDDQDFGVDIAALQNAGHRVETISRSTNPTLLGAFADDTHIVAESAVAPALHAALQTFVKEHWRRIRLGAFNKVDAEDDRLDGLTPLDQENLLLAVLALDILAREEAQKASALPRRNLISLLQSAPEHFISGLQGRRAHWIIAQLIDTRAVMILDKVVSLSAKNPLVIFVRKHWLPARRRVEAEVTAAARTEETARLLGDDDNALSETPVVAMTAMAGNGDRRKRTADDVDDEELLRALQTVFGSLTNGDPRLASGQLEAALVKELGLRGRREGGQLKMHALHIKLIRKTSREEPFYILVSQPLES